MNPEETRRTIGRRKFIGYLGAGLTLGFLGLPGEARAKKEIENTRRVEVPPSIMLHSDYNHETLLPSLIQEIRNQGYEGVTYQDFLDSIKDENIHLPEKPVIISVDDLSMARGVPAYPAFARMREVFSANNFKAVFAVNTNPEQEQDMGRWAEVASWVNAGGIELATHTAMHTNLARPDISIEHIRAEVADSARAIEERTGQKVSTLILPFGAGYDINSSIVRPEIVSVCQEAEIKFIVGIAGGREPLVIEGTTENPVYLMGRVGPGAYRGQETVETAMWEVNNW